ncbi:hypothetical protein GCM10009844_02380 [Nocardioides koreensis]|uniref:GNAT family N-acetyltransferase n=1 Tax=Nocardioides koreensis TaxID=433651 RepID=A0ABN2Z3Q3_9ACTN
MPRTKGSFTLPLCGAPGRGRRRGRLVAVGALRREADGTGHLRAVYRRLGYSVAHTFASGPVNR